MSELVLVDDLYLFCRISLQLRYMKNTAVLVFITVYHVLIEVEVVKTLEGSKGGHYER